MKKIFKLFKHEEKEYEPIVFVNNPISDNKADVIGFNSQVETLNAAIRDGANMIGIIADYGTGKSSMSELLKVSAKKSHYPEPIKINMWDCLTASSARDETSTDISNLTKSFLYQLSNGKNSKFGSYINKILSKNYGNISFAVNKPVLFFVWFILSALSFTIYKMLSIKGTGIMKYIPEWLAQFVPFIKLLAPIFILICAIFALFGIKDMCVAFSHWNMPHKREPEINDVFDTYNLIIKKLKPRWNKKQLIFIDDLDRIDEKEIIIDFLKELYRFQDSLCNFRKKFVFVISIKPESELKSSAGVNSKVNNEKKAEGIENKEIHNNFTKIENEKIYTKVFDTILSLKPIHFDDYDSILLGLIKADKSKEKALSSLLDDFTFDKNLPESFKWIKKGTNLTLRDLKDRLNQAIAIFVSLRNKSYKVKTSEKFEPCAAVAFLENQYPKDYYSLIKNETSFANFIKQSRKTINTTKSSEISSALIELYKQHFTDYTYTEMFIKDFCSMMTNRIFNDDFRMYFYTYPKGCHIKTTEERELCDMLLYSNQVKNYDELDENIRISYSNGNNEIITDVLNSLDTYPEVVIMNSTLFNHACKVSFDKTFKVFSINVLECKKENASMYWDKVKTLPDDNRKKFITHAIDTIVSNNEGNIIIEHRLDMVDSFESDIAECIDIFISSNELIPQITEAEIELINNPLLAISLIDYSKLEEEQFDYLAEIINCQPLTDNPQIYEKAYKIISYYAGILPASDIGKDVLAFMSINHICDDKLFEFVCSSKVDCKEYISYINSFNPEQYSEKYLSLINSKGIIEDINAELVECIMVKNQMFYLAILYFTQNNEVSKLKPHLKQHSRIIKALELVNKKYSEKVLEVRKYCYFTEAIKEYEQLFFNDFPVILKDEFELCESNEEAVRLINTLNIDEDNYELILEMLYSREYSPDETMFLFEYLFDESSKYFIENEVIRQNLVDEFDFERMSFEKLSDSQRSRVYKLISSECNITTTEKAIEITKRLGCFVPEIEEIIQEAPGYKTEYLELIATIDELTALALKWIDDSGEYVTVALSERLCSILFEHKFYHDYVIADTLRKQDLIMREDIPFKIYNEVYKNVPEMFDIMSEHWDFLETLQTDADLQGLDEKLLIPMFKTRQTTKFFSYIFSDNVTQELKEKYLKTFGKFKEEKDSKAFQVLICKKENIELLGSYDMYYRIKEQLWETNPSHKRLFTKHWNERWKKELDEKNLIKID